MKLSFYHIVGIPTMLGALAVVLYIAYLALYPFDTIVPRTQPYRVISPTVEVGHAVLYEVDACKVTNASAVVTRQIISTTGTVTSLPSVVSNLPPGCQRSVVATTIVPTGVAPGQYYLSLTLVYVLNPFQTKTVRLTTEEFTVTAPSEQKGTQ